MGKVIDLSGKKFGRLTVVEFERIKTFPSGKTCAVWRCLCDCGNIISVRSNTLKEGHTTSCGCFQKEQLAKRIRRVGKANAIHGMEGTKIYHVWRGIKNRCLNPNSDHYKSYGGRGILMCDEWKNNFQAFYDYVSKLAHFNEENYTIDRIDVNGNYAPGNVKWSTSKEQARNRRYNVLVKYNGKTMTVAQAAEESGISGSVLYDRVRRYGVDYANLFATAK